ncbi:MAG: sugar phosphate isomerase/epimerase [Sphingobium sp.]
MANRLGIELLSVLGMPPVEHIRLAAELGCAHISTGLTQVPFNPYGFAPWSLRDDAALRREVIAAMRDTGVSISLGEGFGVRPGQEMADRAGDFDLMAELGARGIGGIVMEPDEVRAFDEFARLVEMATSRGMLATIEFAPVHPVGNLAAALALVERIGNPDFRLLIDAMHFFRSGGTLEQLRALDPALIGYAQLCDVPLTSQEDYMQEAMFGRKAPGHGGLPLADFIAALPADIPLGLELPRMAEAEAGICVRDVLRPAVEAARALGA